MCNAVATSAQENKHRNSHKSVCVCWCSSGFAADMFGWLIRKTFAAVNFSLRLCQRFIPLLCRVLAKISASRAFVNLEDVVSLLVQTDSIGPPKKQGFFSRHKADNNMMVYLRGVPMLVLPECETMQCLFLIFFLLLLFEEDQPEWMPGMLTILWLLNNDFNIAYLCKYARYAKSTLAGDRDDCSLQWLSEWLSLNLFIVRRVQFLSKRAVENLYTKWANTR